MAGRGPRWRNRTRLLSTGNVIGRATFCRHQLLSRVDRRGRAHAAINVRRAVGHELVVDPFGQSGRENHAQPVFPRQIRLRFRRTEIDVSFNAKSNPDTSNPAYRSMAVLRGVRCCRNQVSIKTLGPRRAATPPRRTMRFERKSTMPGWLRAITPSTIDGRAHRTFAARGSVFSAESFARKIDRCRGAHPRNCVDEKLRVTTPGSQSRERNQQADGRDQSWPRKNVFSICCGERKPRVNQAMFGHGRQCDKGL